MVAAPATPPPFVARIERVTTAQLPYSWRPGCPVGPPQLRRIRLSYMGFDGRAHIGHLIVNANSELNSAAQFSATVLLIAEAVLLYAAFAALERRVVSWTPRATAR